MIILNRPLHYPLKGKKIAHELTPGLFVFLSFQRLPFYWDAESDKYELMNA